jgi:uncharacterized membrane protein
MNQAQPEFQPENVLPVSTSTVLRRRSLWSDWDLISLGILTVFVLGLAYGNINFLTSLRLVLGSVLVLIAPGYALQAAFFPRADDLDGIERAGLSCGLSIALITVVALILDRMVWGLRLWPMALTLALFILFFSLVAVYRRRILPESERFTPWFEGNVSGWWAEQDRPNRRLYILVAGAILLALFAAFIVLRPKPPEPFTEFYMLGSEGLAENYPREAMAGQPLSVTVGIHNLEGVPVTYRVEALDGEGVIGKSEPVRLLPGGISEVPLSFTPQQVSPDAEVKFLLYRDDRPEPYRTLRLMLKVKPNQ